MNIFYFFHILIINYNFLLSALQLKKVNAILLLYFMLLKSKQRKKINNILPAGQLLYVTTGYRKYGLISQNSIH